MVAKTHSILIIGDYGVIAVGSIETMSLGKQPAQSKARVDEVRREGFLPRPFSDNYGRQSGKLENRPKRWYKIELFSPGCPSGSASLARETLPGDPHRAQNSKK
jgi:hypothetical protein